MLLLTSTSDLVQLVTGTATTNIEVHASWVDNNAGTITPGRQNTIISTATTTTIVPAPGSGVQRNVKGVYITNTSASTSCQATVVHTDGTNGSDLMGVTLLGGENLGYREDGSWVHHDSQGGEYSGRSTTDIWSAGYGIGGTISETIPRMLCNEANLAALTSGTLLMTAIYLRANQRINNISYHSATTAAGTPTNQFFALFDTARALLAQTANATTGAWAANSIKTLALTSTYVVPSDGLYYVGIMVTATTVPTLKGLTAKTASQLAAQVPILHGNSTAGLTTSLPNPAAAITAGVNAVWAAVT